MSINVPYNYITFENIKPYLMSDTFFIFDNSLSKENVNLQSFKNIKWFIDENGYLIKNKTHDKENIFNDESFLYKFNDFGFRTKQFNKLNNNKTNVLFLGCSITSGVGLPENLIWTNQLINKKNKNINFYNLGMHGASVQQIFHNFITFIKKYGKPSHVFILFPEIDRTIAFDEKNNMFVKITSFHENDVKNKNFYVAKKIKKNNTIEDLILFNIEKIHTIEFLCKEMNINLTWSTWSKDYQKLLKEINFCNYIEIPALGSEELQNYEIENILNLKYWDHARDKSHPGTRYHSIIANIFFNKF
jgi:lysophospholipase L1-like esterase